MKIFGIPFNTKLEAAQAAKQWQEVNNLPFDEFKRINDMKKFLMHINTGSIDTEENWRSEFEAAKSKGFPEELGWNDESDFDNLVEVIYHKKSKIWLEV